MATSEVQKLLARGKFREAAKMLDRMLSSDNANGELWYLRGIASMKMKNYDAAQEYFEKALFSGKKAKYYQMEGMAHFEIFELEQAVESFINAVSLDPSDATSYFFIAVSYIMMDDPRASEYLRKARSTDAKRTRQLLTNFYNMFLKEDPRVTEGQRKKIVKYIGS